MKYNSTHTTEGLWRRIAAQAALFVALLALCGCGKDVFLGEDGLGDGTAGTAGDGTRSVLHVRTRAPQASGGEESAGAVEWPVALYVFAKDGTCVAAETLEEDSEGVLSLSLNEGQYTVCAVSGADPERYVLPGRQEASEDSPLPLRSEKVQGDLLTARSAVTLEDGVENSLTLGLERRVLQLQRVTISRVPSAATAVTVRVQPLREAVTLGGGYSGEGGTFVAHLERQADVRTWQTEGAAFLLPSQGKATVSVSVSTPDGTRSYAYTMDEPLEANYKVNISGTYTEAVGVTLSGTITAADWAGEKTVSFEFDESGSKTVDAGGGSGGSQDDSGQADLEDGQEPTTQEPAAAEGIPAVGSTYKGCYVLSVTDDGDGAVQAVLLSPNECTLTGVANSSAKTYIDDMIERNLPALSVDGIDGWRVMNLSEAKLFYQARNDISGVSDKEYYFYNNKYLCFKMQSSSFSSSSNYSGKTTLFRPVATVTIEP